MLELLLSKPGQAELVGCGHHSWWGVGSVALWTSPEEDTRQGGGAVVPRTAPAQLLSHIPEALMEYVAFLGILLHVAVFSHGRGVIFAGDKDGYSSWWHCCAFQTPFSRVERVKEAETGQFLQWLIPKTTQLLLVPTQK